MRDFEPVVDEHDHLVDAVYFSKRKERGGIFRKTNSDLENQIRSLTGNRKQRRAKASQLKRKAKKKTS